MKSNIRVAKFSVSPDNFINWDLLRAVGKIKPREEVVDQAFDIEIKNGLIDFKVKLRKDLN